MSDDNGQPPASPWSEATGLPLDVLRQILLLAYRHQQETGREMTATELRVALRQPGGK